jgi:integrase
MTLDQAFLKYDEWFRKGHKESAFGVTLPAVEKFIEHAGADIDTRELTADHVQRFLDSFDDHSPIYVRNTFARIRAFVRWIDRKYRDAVDLRAVKGIELPKVPAVADEVPPMETIKALLAKLSTHEWLGDYCTVLLETGMRPGEALAVRGVDLRDELLDIKPHDDWSPKSEHSVRTIPLSETARKILQARKEKLFDKRFPIFGFSTGKMRNAKEVGRLYREAMKTDGKIPAQWKDCNIYFFRHAFASFHAKTKIDRKPNPGYMVLQDLAKYMGHAPGSSRTLERWYIDARAEDIGAPVSLTGERQDGAVIPMKANQ